MKNKFIPFAEFIKTKSDTQYLHEDIWKESTICLLHSPGEVDKSAIAFEIASKVAAPDRGVIYVNTDDRACDFTAADKPANLFIFTPEYESPDDPTDYADLVIAGIQEAIDNTGVRTFVIDSITRIAALSFGRNASAAYVMKRLAILQVRYKLSLLIIANDTTKSADRALLTLSASQIKPNPETSECSENSVNSECSENSKSPEQSECLEHSHSSTSTINKQPRRKLSRRDRRILRRQSPSHQ